MTGTLPLLFACSGCSPAGRLAYDIALELDRRGVAEMSCLAGIGARKSHFLKQLAGRDVWIVDGCPIECARGVLELQHGGADAHIRLHELGVRKSSGAPENTDLEHLLEGALQQVHAHQQP